MEAPPAKQLLPPTIPKKQHPGVARCREILRNMACSVMRKSIEKQTRRVAEILLILTQFGYYDDLIKLLSECAAVPVMTFAPCTIHALTAIMTQNGASVTVIYNAHQIMLTAKPAKWSMDLGGENIKTLGQLYPSLQLGAYDALQSEIYKLTQGKRPLPSNIISIFESICAGDRVFELNTGCIELMLSEIQIHKSECPDTAKTASFAAEIREKQRAYGMIV